jgi:outer membrane protein OmpA-like peptidoglycan-associated protein/Mg-chelatase subunit ChlD
MDSDPSEPQLIISRVDNSDPSKIKAHFHLLNGDDMYLTGAASKLFGDIWCAVYDTSDAGVSNIKNFKVYEVTESKADPISLAMVMDLSGSMGDERARTMQQAVKEFIQNKASDDRISLIRYDSKVQRQLPPTADKNSLLSTHSISGLQGFGGGTATIDAALEGVMSLENEPSDRVKAVIVFTDGKDNSSKKKLDYVAEYANSKGIFINTVDYGYNVIPGMLEEMAAKTRGIYHQIYSQEEFEPLFKDIYTRINNHYVVEFEPEYFGRHRVGLQLCLKDTTLTASAGFDNTPKPGQIALLDIHFDTNKSNLKSDQMDRVKKLLLLMRSRPEMKIELQGHTDSRGDDELNQKLSQARADAVRIYLIDQGIDPGRILSKGYGETMPIADNETEEGRAANRRTQFKIID